MSFLTIRAAIMLVWGAVSFGVGLWLCRWQYGDGKIVHSACYCRTRGRSSATFICCDLWAMSPA
jgi:hypothetical protein